MKINAALCVNKAKQISGGVMSFTEQDLEILSEEIKQIEQTLKETGRNVQSYDDDETSSDGETKDENTVESDQWKPIFQDDVESFTADKHNVDLRGTKYPTSPLIQEIPSIVDASTPIVTDISDNVLLNKFFDNTFDEAGNQNESEAFSAPCLPAIDIRSIETTSKAEKPTGLSKKLKNRIRRETTLDRGKNPLKRIKKQGSDDGTSTVDVSLPPSLTSLPEKEKDKINMTNLYVERIFRGYRKNKNPSVASVSYQGQKFESKNLKSSANLATLENLLQSNRQYQELLQEELKKVEIALARNEKAQDELMISTGEKDDDVAATLFKACIGKFMTPYFKDGDGLGPPANEETIERKNKLIAGAFPKPSSSWKATETAALEEGVYNNNLEKRLEPLLLRVKKIDKDIKDKKKDKEKAKNKKLRADLLKEITEVKSIPHEEILKDSFDVDFFKISKNYLPSRDEFECRVQWFNVIHPSINQKPFSKDEDSMLIKLAKKYENHHWETISKELGTQRTPVQCLQRYQRTLNKDMIKATWEKEDDEKLKEAVKIHGRYWVAVADYMGNRTADQCLHRWNKSINPGIKRGKWTDEEDQKLLEAVEKYGAKNWKKIKTEVKDRTDAQCRERYVSSLDPTINWDPFTEEEDKQLMLSAKKYGTGKWAKVASELPGRRDHQVWRRYKQLCAEDYHQYRKENAWKKSSVMSYFLHRKSEKRGYELKDLDVNYSPTINHAEATKLQLEKGKLMALGYTDNEIKHELARLHFEGKFSRVRKRTVKRYRRRKVYTASDAEQESKQVQSEQKTEPKRSLFEEELVNEVEKIISSTTDPEKELCSLGSEKLTATWDVMFIRKPKLAGKRDPDKLWRASFELKDLPYRCDEIIRRYRQKKILHTEAMAALDEFEKIIRDESIDEIRKDVYNELLLSVREKIESIDTTWDEVKNAIVNQDTLEIQVRNSSSRIKVVNDGTSPYAQEKSPKSKLKRTRDEIQTTLSYQPKVKKRKSQTPRKLKATETNNKHDIVDGSLSENSGDEDDDDDEEEEEEEEEEDDNDHEEHVEATDELKTFTLLLQEKGTSQDVDVKNQALHVDTNGVMQSLPESQQSSSTQPSSSNNKCFPKCYPLSPNIASLRGFRSLLLHRRKLSEIVQSKYGLSTPNPSYHDTRPFMALRERFRSLFIWPAFLATFIPKYIPKSPISQNAPHQGGPSIMGPLAHKWLKKPAVVETSPINYIEERRKQTTKSMKRLRAVPLPNQFGFSRMHAPRAMMMHPVLHPSQQRLIHPMHPHMIHPHMMISRPYAPYGDIPRTFPGYRPAFHTAFPSKHIPQNNIPTGTSKRLMSTQISKNSRSKRIKKIVSSSDDNSNTTMKTTSKDDHSWTIDVTSELGYSSGEHSRTTSTPVDFHKLHSKPSKSSAGSMITTKSRHNFLDDNSSLASLSDDSQPAAREEVIGCDEKVDKNGGIFIPPNLQSSSQPLHLLADTVLLDASRKNIKKEKDDGY